MFGRPRIDFADGAQQRAAGGVAMKKSEFANTRPDSTESDISLFIDKINNRTQMSLFHVCLNIHLYRKCLYR